MTEGALTPPREKRRILAATALLVAPLVVLAGVIVLFLRTGGGLQLTSPVPVETLTVERISLTPGRIELALRNAGPQDLTISQVIINDAVWPFHTAPGSILPRLGTTTLTIDYPWSHGEAYAIRLFTASAVPFDIQIPVAFETPKPGMALFVSFALIGLYVGVLPIFLGLLWFPALRQLGRRWMAFLLAVTVGLLIFLGLDTLAEAAEQAAALPGAFQGIGLVGLGAVGTFLLLAVISGRQAAGRSEASRRLSLAYQIALGIGLHNLGEGLAIGAAFNLGQMAFGSFLVVGFILQNITEGLAIIAPILHDRPGLRPLATLGALGGAPAIIGAWLGGFAPSPAVAVVFLAVGTGAIFQVVYEISKLITKAKTHETMPLTVHSGVVAGMLLLWVTGLMVK